MHFDSSWVFLLFIVIAGVLRIRGWIAQASNKTDRQSSPPPPLPRREAETDTDRMRKFLEALGQPPGAAPPPRVQRRATPPPVSPVHPRQSPVLREALEPRRVFNPLPPLTTQPPAVPVLPPSQLSIPTIPAPVSIGRSSVEMIPIDIPPGKETSTGVEDSFRRLLGSPASLRQALILREILGPPRALDPVALAGSA